MLVFKNIVYIVGEDFKLSDCSLLQELEDNSSAHFLFASFSKRKFNIEKVVDVNQDQQEIVKHLRVADLFVVIEQNKNHQLIDSFVSFIPLDCRCVLFNSIKSNSFDNSCEVYIGDLSQNLKQFIDKYREDID